MEKYCLVQMEVGEFKNVIYSLYDREVAENIIEVENTFDDIKVYGVIGKPQISRSNRRNQIFFVNKRYITDKVINTTWKIRILYIKYRKESSIC